MKIRTTSTVLSKFSTLDHKIEKALRQTFDRQLLNLMKIPIKHFHRNHFDSVFNHTAMHSHFNNFSLSTPNNYTRDADSNCVGSILLLSSFTVTITINLISKRKSHEEYSNERFPWPESPRSPNILVSCLSFSLSIPLTVISVYLTSWPRRRCSRCPAGRAARWRSRCRCCCAAT